MVEERAVVVRVEADVAHLEIERGRPCGLCGSTRGCGVSLWGRLFGSHARAFTVDNVLGAAVGERVVVGLDESLLLRGALRAYLVNALLVCLGGVCGASLADAPALRDGYAVAGALAGLLLGLAWLRFSSDRGRVGGFRPVMLRRADSMVLRHCSR
jgi:sigma-E factor negative regulatory protein RseC